MLVKRGKTLRKLSLFLERIFDRDYPNSCEICLFKNRKCDNIVCAGYDKPNYSYVVKKRLNYGRGNNKVCKE